ncbi:MAG TPA: helix-turn-helix domain-containing protein [Actinomycetota bacterium]|nr:helix-turn-helix domain-containing protein [Actinomycetota bacterium]
MSFARRLKQARLSAGMTQAQLAEPMYTHAYVSTLEAGRRQPSPTAAKHFAQKLGMDVDELLTGRPPHLAASLRLTLQEARVALSRGEYEETDRIADKAVKDAKKYRLVRLHASGLELLALAAERRSQLGRAQELYQEIEELLREEPLTALADARAGRIRCLQMDGDPRYAIYLGESLLEQMRQKRIDDPAARVRIMAPMTQAYFETGMRRQASAVAEELLRLAPRVQDPFNLAVMHMNVSRVLMSDGHVADADESLRRAEDYFKTLDLQTELGRAHLARGYLLLQDGRLDEAEEELNSALAIFELTSSKVDEGRTYAELGRLSRLRGDTRAAIDRLNKATTLLKDAKDAAEQAIVHREMGLALAETDTGAAQKSLRKAIVLFNKIDDVVEGAKTYRLLGEFLEVEREADAAKSAYLEGLRLLERM